MSSNKELQKTDKASVLSLTPEDQKRLLVANFLYEASLHWNRPLDEDNELANCWLSRVQKFTVSAIKKGFDEYLESETFFPVPGSVFPYIKWAGADRSKPRVGVYEVNA